MLPTPEKIHSVSIGGPGSTQAEQVCQEGWSCGLRREEGEGGRDGRRVDSAGGGERVVLL